MTKRTRVAGRIAAIALVALVVPLAHRAFVLGQAPGESARVVAHAGGMTREPSSLRRPGRVPPMSLAASAEAFIEQTRTVDAAARSIGVGPAEKIIVPGRPGLVRITVGTRTGAVVATETLQPAVPGLVRRIPAPGTPLVALTFDDGPWPGQTEAILSILKQRNVPATFFMVGLRVERSPDVARAIVAAGHAAGNHTYSHAFLDSGDPTKDAWEIEYTNQTILAATGVRPTWLRAPGGRLGGPAEALIAQAGMRSALWTVDPQDWADDATPDAVAWGVLSTVHPGAIVLLHDGGGDQSATIAALPTIIDGLRASGYEFVTLDEMPGVRATW